MSNPDKRFFEFGPYRVDSEDRLLLREGNVVPLPPKIFDILLAFVQRSGRVLDKDELMQQVWPDTFVEEGNLARNVSTLRRILGESSEGNQYIETIPRRGYRFNAKVRELSDGTVVVRERSRVTIEQEDETDGLAEIAAEQTPVAIEVMDESRRVAGAQLQPARQTAMQTATLDAVAQPAQIDATTATRTRRWMRFTLAAMLIAVALIISFFFGKRMGQTRPPVFSQVTFRNGGVTAARFAPDSRMFIYSAQWEGKPSELFTALPDTPESRAIGLTDVSLLAISTSGELAVSLNPTINFITRGTLARVPLTGGAPREVLKDVAAADWSPNGKDLAVVHYEGGKCRLEFPIGNVLYERDAGGWISEVRIAPRGDRIAFIDHPVVRFDEYGVVAVIDLQGNKRNLSKEYFSTRGLAWSPSGDEVWFTAGGDDLNRSLRAVNMSGKERLITHVPGCLNLQDIAKDGRALVTREDARIGMMVLAPGETQERDLSWLDGSWIRGISSDGQTVLFDEENAASKPAPTVYIRKTDGSPAVRLGDGTAVSLSPDGKWALAHRRYTTPTQMVLLPTGAGDLKVIGGGDITFREASLWLPDSTRVLLRGNEPERPVRSYIYDRPTANR